MPNSDENRNINEVIVNGETLLSTRGNTVTEDTLAEGETAQDKSGKTITGNMQGGSNSNPYFVTDSLSSNFSEDDYIPYYDVSEQKKHNTLIGKFIDFLKGIFVTKSNGSGDVYQSGDTFTLRMNDIDASEPDNDVDTTRFPSTSNILDRVGRIITRFESVVSPNGKIGAKIYVRNYDQDGNRVGQKGIQFHMDKSGNLTYQIDDADAFRAAINTIDQTGIQIPANADLNTYITADNYVVGLDVTAQTISNIPVQLAGKLIILRGLVGTDAKYISQIYISRAYTNIYTRGTGDWGSTWTEWKQLASIDDSYALKSGFYTALISENDDLNNYTIGGTYDCTLASIAQSLSHCPVGVAFKLQVDVENNPNIVCQTITLYNAQSAKPFVRTKNNTLGWGEWQQLASINDFYALKSGVFTASISANQNLDDYITGGTYDCKTNAIAQSLLNCPVEQTFKLKVDVENNPNIVSQTISLYDDIDARPWFRIRNSQNEWGYWYQLITSDDIIESQFSSGYAEATVDGSAISALIQGFELKAGVIVSIKTLSTITTACTLNINSTGAKSIKMFGGINPTFGIPLYYGDNTFMYDGIYYRHLGVNRTPVLAQQDYVADTSGNLVMGWGYGTNRAQIKYNLTYDKLRWNYYKNSTWRGDVSIADYDDLVTQTLGITIPNNSNLDNYTTNGIYNVDSNANAATMTNLPVARAGKLIVMRVAGNSYIKQFYITYDNLDDSNDGVFQRTYNGNVSTWRSWHRLAYIADFADYLPLTGGTLTGYLNLKSSRRMIASGAYMPSVDDTLENIINELRFSNGAYGSFHLKTAYTNGYTTIPVAWYNYLYIPHRIGGENWQTPTTWDSDNVLHGTLFLFGMNNSNGMFRLRINNLDSTITINELENLQKGNCYVGTCTTAANERAKVVTVDDNFVLRKGVRIAVKFTNTNTYENVTANPITLNVNGTGAKNIWFWSTHSGAGNTGTQTSYYGYAGSYIYYVYDGTYWVWDGHGGDNNNTNFLRNDASTTLTTSGTPTLTIKSSTIDTKQANNGVTATHYPAYIILDKNGEVFARFESVVETNGNLGTFLYSRNYNTSTSEYFLGGIKISSDKSGNLWYNITNPHKFLNSVGTGFGTCTTAANARVKVVTINNFVLTIGGIIGVKFTNTNTYSATADNKICLNVNGTGEKPIYYSNGYTTGTETRIYGIANRTIFYMYDGSNWVWISSGYEYDTTYSNMSLSELLTGTATNDRTLRASILNDGIQAYGTAFGSCESTADTVNKIVTLADSNWTLRVGAIIGIKFSVSNTASSVTLNVNNTGAKSIYYNNGVYTGSSSSVCGYANRVCYYMYDGTYWVFLHNGIVDSNTTYTPQKLGFGYGTCATAEATTAKVATLSSYSLVTNGIVAIKFTYAVPANATLNINSAGAKPIYFRGAAIIANIIKAGDIATFIYNGSQYHLISIDFTSKTASSNGTDLSLVTTGEKATWNSKTSNVGTVTSITTGVGLTGGTITGSGTIKANLKTETPSTLESAAMTSTASRQYPVVLDKDGYLSVNVPWSYSTITAALIEAGTSTSARLITAKLFRTYIDNKTWMGTCDTEAATAEKVATVDNGFLLAKGARIGIKFSVTNSASDVTLNVNDTGAKSIYYNNAVYTGTSSKPCGYANRYNFYIYDGTYWVWDSCGADDNSTYSPATLGFGYGTCATEAATTAKVATLSNYSLVTGGYVSIKFTYDVPASATLNINSKGAKNIYYRGAAIKAGVIKAGDIATFVYSTRYHLVGIDRDNLKSTASNNNGIISGYTAGTDIVVDKMYTATCGDIVTVDVHLHSTVDITTSDYVVLSGFPAPLNHTACTAFAYYLMPMGFYLNTNGKMYARTSTSQQMQKNIVFYISLTYIKA